MTKKNQKWMDEWECMERWVTGGGGKDDKGPTKEVGMCFGGAQEKVLAELCRKF